VTITNSSLIQRISTQMPAQLRKQVRRDGAFTTEVTDIKRTEDRTDLS
jgi:hypothetical protein